MRFAIIDLANLFARARHVTQGDAYTKAGMALHILFRSLRKLYREREVDHLVFCVEGRSWRYEAYPAYKSRRKLDRLAMSPQEKEEAQVFYEVEQSLAAYLAEKTRCTVLQSEGVEGDDFVGRWIDLHPDDEHIILSGDSDFVQLLGPRVTIVDGVQERTITVDGVTTFKGEECVFRVDPASGKVKVSGTVEECRKKHDRDQKDKLYHDPAHAVTPFEWVKPKAEDEWWRQALFIKLVRGDQGDSVFSAYPGVRYKGSSKKTGISEAWTDRETKGFHWTNFMNATWEKLLGVDEAGANITQTVTVKDEIAINESLIDLRAQPQEIKDLMDAVIVQAVQKDPVQGVGIKFMKFCNQNDLPQLLKEAEDHGTYLAAGYAR